MQNFIYDIAKKVFRATDGSTLSGYAPSISFGEKPVWALQLVDTSQDSPLDISGIYAWRAALDTDFSTDTEPMCRTTEGISTAAGEFGPVVSVPLNTATQRFLQVCNGRQKTAAFFELAGLDANGDTTFYLCFPVSCLFPIDPVAAGILEGVDVTTLTQSQIEAIASAAAQAMLGKEVRDAVAQAMEGYDPYPEGGTSGQVLTRTDTGAQWADAPSGGSSGESAYTLPPATADTLGGVKVGSGLSITADGTLSATDTGSSGDVDLSSYATKEELSTGLSGKAAAIHSHSADQVTGVAEHLTDTSIHVPSDGTTGQVLTLTASGAKWHDAASSGTGEASTDAGAVRVVKDYADYLDVSSLASEQAIHHSATFIPAADVTGDTIEVRKAISGEVTDDTLRKGRIYVQINECGTGGDLTREVTTSTYVVQKVRIVNSSTGGTYGNWVIISGREGTPYLYPDSYEKAYGGQHGFTFADRQALEDTSLNGGWPTVALDAQTLLDAYKADLEQDGTYIGTTPWYAADAKTSGEVIKRVNGVWRKGNVAYNSSTGETSESFDEETEYEIVLLFKDSTGSYQDTLTPYSSETNTEHNTRLGNPVIDCLDITPDPLRLAIQALEGTALEVAPGKAYSATLTANATLSATGGEDGYRQEAFLDVNPGTYSLTPGDGITFAQDLTADKVNHCRIIWHGVSARLLVDDVTDATASGGSGGSGEEGGGSGESGGETGGETPSDGWPAKIVVSNVSSSFDADVSAYAGTYTRTGETLTVLGEAIPIWSNGSKYIYGVSSSMGSDLEEPAIALYDQKGSNDAYMSYAYRMKSDSPSAWTMADAAGAIGMSATITEEGGGGDSGGSSDAFPTTFSVTACDGNGAAVGTYKKTDSTTTVNGKEYPVYSMTQATLGTTFYIFVLKYRMGETGAFWALSSGDYNASGDGYSTLGSVAAGSDGLPSSQTWEASSSSATVSWA